MSKNKSGNSVCLKIKQSGFGALKLDYLTYLVHQYMRNVCVCARMSIMFEPSKYELIYIDIMQMSELDIEEKQLLEIHIIIENSSQKHKNSGLFRVN